MHSYFTSKCEIAAELYREILKKDVLWLIETVKKLSVGLDDNANDLLTAHDAVKKFYNFVQDRAEPNVVYMERFKDSWNAAVASAGSVACLVPEIMKTSKKYNFIAIAKTPRHRGHNLRSSEYM